MELMSSYATAARCGRPTDLERSLHMDVPKPLFVHLITENLVGIVNVPVRNSWSLAQQSLECGWVGTTNNQGMDSVDLLCLSVRRTKKQSRLC